MNKPICFALVLALSLAPIVPATACTGIRLKAGDGAVVCARTMEFGVVLPPAIVAIPEGTELTGMAPGGKAGLRWSAQYAAVGMGATGYEVVADGLNVKGLGAGLFYHPGYAKYADLEPGREGQAISAMQVPTYLLTTCATVAEARAAMARVAVAPVAIEGFGGVPPFHVVVHDASGGCIVIEFLDGETTVFDDPLGVITNAPSFDWHVTNLRNYVNLTATNVPPVTIDGLDLGPLGQGSGLLGLPGDFTPPSRFVRAVAFTRAAEPAADAEGAVNAAFHILNSFDIVPGYVRADRGGQASPECTQWTAAADLAHRRYYYRTYEDPKIRYVDLGRLDLSGEKMIVRPIGDKRPTFRDETDGLAH